MVPAFRRYIETLEGFVKDPDFKHGDFWKRKLVLGTFSLVIGFADDVD